MEDCDAVFTFQSGSAEAKEPVMLPHVQCDGLL